MEKIYKDIVDFIKNHRDLIIDSRSLRALLADGIPNNKSLRHILQVAYDEGITKRISSETNMRRLVYQYKKILMEDYAINENLADLSIEIWLGVFNFDENQIYEWVETKKYLDDVQRESIKSNYLKQAEYYEDILDLEEYLQHSENDERARYEYISLLFDTLVEPKYKFNDGEVEYIANLCIKNIDMIKEGTDITSRYRLLRAKYAKASLSIILGDLKYAYRLLCEIAPQIDMIAREMNQIGDAGDILIRIETNIHQIKELSGIDDGEFFSIESEEIKFQEAHVNQLLFNYKGYYCFPILIPLIGTYRNAFYSVYDNNSERVTSFGHGGQYFALNQMKLGYSGRFVVKYWPINLYSGVSKAEYKDWTWKTQEKVIDRTGLQKFILENPYHKTEGYISSLIASNNKRMHC